MDRSTDFSDDDSSSEALGLGLGMGSVSGMGPSPLTEGNLTSHDRRVSRGADSGEGGYGSIVNGGRASAGSANGAGLGPARFGANPSTMSPREMDSSDGQGSEWVQVVGQTWQGEAGKPHAFGPGHFSHYSLKLPISPISPVPPSLAAHHPVVARRRSPTLVSLTSSRLFLSFPLPFSLAFIRSFGRSVDRSLAFSHAS